MMDTKTDSPTSSGVATGWAFKAEIVTEWDNRFGIAAQLEEIAKQIRRGIHIGNGFGSGGRHSWSVSPNVADQQPRREDS